MACLRRALLAAALASAAPGCVEAAAPVLYSQAAHSSPVSAAPDDLLLLAGAGLSRDDVVVYQLLDAATSSTPPARVPAESTTAAGVAPIVSAGLVPNALVVRMPPSLLERRIYALWARSPQGDWSNRVLVNDARPMWFSPDEVSATQRPAGRPRQLKLIGRNLRASLAAAAQVRLTGSTMIELDVQPMPNSDDDQLLQARLPARLPVGRYRVSLRQAGGTWTDIAGQEFVVRPDPRPAASFDVGAAAFGGCRSDDGVDDTPCVRRALEAASRQGGTVRFGPGVWTFSVHDGGASTAGLKLPRGVNLEGRGAAVTTLVRMSARPPRGAWFTLLGENSVRGIHFKEPGTPGLKDPTAPVLALGAEPETGRSRAAPTLEHIVIADNVFDGSHPAIGGSGAPLRHLVITGNEFGAYDFGLILRGNRFDLQTRFTIEDSIVADNVFMPGGYLDVPIRQGAIASQLGAAHRLEFSGNVADGASTRYLRPGDAPGWRAAFFWSLSGDAQQLLIADNDISCTGDKDGDGEAIALDNDGNTFAFGEARAVRAAAKDSIDIGGLPRSRQAGLDVPAGYYAGHWVQVVGGEGLGQTRRIRSYRLDVPSGRMVAQIEPHWDVTPGPGSRVIVARQFSQVSITGNRIDNRNPRCRKSNRTAPKAGAISLWGSVADSRVGGNRQYDGDGILLNQNYNAEDQGCPACDAGASTVFFVDVHANHIDGEYDWSSDCSHSGIYLANSAAAVKDSRPPTVSFGVSVARNAVSRADGLRGGAISVPLTWQQGPAPHDWPLVRGLLIHHNDIRHMDGAAPRPQCTDRQLNRIGINLNLAAMVYDTVLYANACSGVPTPLHDGGRSTVRVCAAPARDSCECGPVLSK